MQCKSMDFTHFKVDSVIIEYLDYYYYDCYYGFGFVVWLADSWNFTRKNHKYAQVYTSSHTKWKIRIEKRNANLLGIKSGNRIFFHVFFWFKFIFNGKSFTHLIIIFLFFPHIQYSVHRPYFIFHRLLVSKKKMQYLDILNTHQNRNGPS